MELESTDTGTSEVVIEPKKYVLIKSLGKKAALAGGFLAVVIGVAYLAGKGGASAVTEVAAETVATATEQ